MSRWRPYTPHPATSDLRHAGAGSDRIYYQDPATGAVCYRRASWGTHGTRVHGFRDSGPGHGVDPETLEHDGTEYPESEF